MALSLPGLGLEEPQETQAGEATQDYTLPKGCEWRFEVAVGKYVKVKILTGTAELFGTELLINSTYTFATAKAAIYTWHGCTFSVSTSAPSALQSEYTAEETTMNDFINVHFALETLREEAKQQRKRGPGVLILGSENAGKSSLAKTLTGYAARNARSPVVVNLDSRGEGVLSIPGTMTCTVFKGLVDVEEGWGVAPMSGPAGVIPAKLPLVYYHGLPNPQDRDGVLYKALVSRLALAVAGRLQQDVTAREAGVIIDTSGSLTSTRAGSATGYDIVQHIVSEFGVSAIICLGSERLYNDMVKRFDNSPIVGATKAQDTISVIKLAKSGGCVDRDELFMRAFRARQVREYFYGDVEAGIGLGPRQQQVDFNQLSVFRIVGAGETLSSGEGDGGQDAEDDFLPGGHDTEDFYGGGPSSSRVALPSTQLYERVIAPHPGMRNCVLAVMNCDTEAEQEELRDSSVMGFLYVVDVDEAKGRISVLSPVAGRVPGRAIIWGPWPEGVLGVVGG